MVESTQKLPIEDLSLKEKDSDIYHLI